MEQAECFETSVHKTLRRPEITLKKEYNKEFDFLTICYHHLLFGFEIVNNSCVRKCSTASLTSRKYPKYSFLLMAESI
jgi:hypothetical protein